MVTITCYQLVCFDRVQDQVTGVISVMKDNINRVLDRGEKLEDLQEKSGKHMMAQLYTLLTDGFISEDLAESASHFRVSSRRLERQMWWKNCRVSFE